MRNILLLILCIAGWTYTSAQAITQVEYFINEDPGEGNAQQVSFDPSALENITFTANIAGYKGVNKLCVRAKDSDGKWSIISGKLFYVNPDVVAPPAENIDYVEYFFDVDPGQGNATPLPVTPAVDVTITETLSTDGLTTGIHNLVVRGRSESGVYSIISRRLVYINPVVELPTPSQITYVEYFFDQDPGEGNGESLAVTAGTDVTISDVLDVSGLTPGIHKLVVRAKSDKGLYSIISSRLIYINREVNVTVGGPVNYVEYFFDTDPGKGNGNAFSITPGTDVTISEDVDVNALKPGVHQFVVRARDDAGFWSIISKKLIYVNRQSDNSPAQVTMLEYFVDRDPGNGKAIKVSITPGDDITVAKTLSMKGLENGNHEFVFRARDNKGFWSYNDTITVAISQEILTSVNDGDSLALVDLYRSTNGDNWSQNDNWLVGRVETWLGVEVIENFKVGGINLPENNLSGTLPESIVVLDEISSIDLSGNNIETLDYLGHLEEDVTLDVSGNALTFGSLEQNAELPGINYADQQPIDEARAFRIPAGGSKALLVSTSGTANNYQWLYNGVPIENAESSEYVITDIGRHNMGDYVCQVTSDIVPDLTISTRVQNVLAVAGISGTLFGAPDEVAENGYVRLFRVSEDNNYDTLGLPFEVENGNFSFSDLVLDNYQLVGFADTLDHVGALPTYYGNTIYWEEASTIELNFDETDADITSQYEPEEAPAGTGLIQGTVTEEVADEGGRTKAKKRVASAGVSVRRGERSGRGKALELVTYVFTNDQGEFELKDLPDDEYILNIQYPGFPMDTLSDIDITIGPNIDQRQAVEAEIKEGKITVRKLIVTGIEGPTEYFVKAFPNPSASVVHFEFDKESSARKIELIDLTGRKLEIMNGHAKNNSYSVDHLKPGMYIFNVIEMNMRVRSVRIEILEE